MTDGDRRPGLRVLPGSGRPHPGAAFYPAAAAGAQDRLIAVVAVAAGNFHRNVAARADLVVGTTGAMRGEWVTLEVRKARLA